MDPDSRRSQTWLCSRRRGEARRVERASCPIYYPGRAIFHSSRPLDLLSGLLSLCPVDFQLSMRSSRDLNNVSIPFFSLLLISLRLAKCRIKISRTRISCLESRALNLTMIFQFYIRLRRECEECKTRAEKRNRRDTRSAVSIFQFFGICQRGKERFWFSNRSAL